MPHVVKGDKRCFCDKHQLPAMKASGWKVEKTSANSAGGVKAAKDALKEVKEEVEEVIPKAELNLTPAAIKPPKKQNAKSFAKASGK